MTIKKIHSSIDFEKFKDMYINKSFNNLDFNIIYYQKLYLKCFLLYNDINSYNEFIYKFKERFKVINYLITENIYRKLKGDTNWYINNLNIEEICKGLVNIN